VQTVSFHEALAKLAKIETNPRAFFVHVRVPEHIAENLRDVQKRVISDPEKHRDVDHITLCYTKKPLEDHPPDKVHQALTALREIGETTEPIEAKLQGWGYFDGASTGGKTSTALVALVDAPGLEHLHVDMVRKLKDLGIEPSDLHVFTPHITLGYLGHEGRVDVLPPLSGKFTIDKAHVASRDHHEVPLSKTTSLGEKAAKFAELDSMRALTESMYATHGPQGVMRTIGANPQLRSPMLANVKRLAGAASPRPQQGMFSGVMQTQATPLHAAVSGKIGSLGVEAAKFAVDYSPSTNFTMSTSALRMQHRRAPGEGETSAVVGPATAQTGAMHSGGGFK
jgi:2'-5' RNA ligase